MAKRKYRIYVIGSTSGHCKIGYSNNPQRRLRQLQSTQGPYAYTLEYWWGFETEKEARSIEAYLHKMFNKKRVRGEWFDLSPKDLITLGSLEPSFIGY